MRVALVSFYTLFLFNFVKAQTGKIDSVYVHFSTADLTSKIIYKNVLNNAVSIFFDLKQFDAFNQKKKLGIYFVFHIPSVNKSTFYPLYHIDKSTITSISPYSISEFADKMKKGKFRKELASGIIQIIFVIGNENTEISELYPVSMVTKLPDEN